MINKSLAGLCVLTSLLYPFALYGGYGRELVFFLSAFWGLRLILQLWSRQRGWELSLIGAGFFGFVGVFSMEMAVFYPSLINLGLGFAFCWSMRGQSMITYFASIEHRLKGLPPLSQDEVAYTRFLNKVWIGVFAFNASLCTIFAVSEQKEAWMLYSGLGAYVLIGLVFGGERILRNFLKEMFCKSGLNN